MLSSPPHPPWYRIYPFHTSIPFLTAITLRFAYGLRIAASEARAIEAQNDAQELLRFEEVVADRGGDDDSMADDDSVATDASLAAHLDSGSSRVFRTPSLRPNQRRAITSLLTDPVTEGKLLVVERTGGGKSLTLMMSAITVAGISLVIVPLLSLTANQMSRIKSAVQRYGAVDAHHVDELSVSDINNKLVPKIESFDYNSTTTLFLLCSPQCLADNHKFRRALIGGAKRKVLRLVAIDEAHLFAMHGRTFRESIRVLRICFFSVVFRNGLDYHPLFLLLTATMTIPLLEGISHLTRVDWTLKSRQQWSSPSDFRQRYIKMGFDVTGDIGQIALPILVKKLREDKTMYACIFVNFRSETVKWGGVLEEQIADAKMDVDVLEVHGDMDKHEKFAFTRLFTTSIRMKHLHPRILVATAAANTGIEQALLTYVLRVGIPRCIVTFLQERGRNSRTPGLRGLFAIYSNWSLFVKLLLTVLLPRDSGSDEIPEHDFVNSTVTARSPEKRNADGKGTSEKRLRCPLTDDDRRNNIDRAHQDLIEMTRLFFLPALGCIHCRTEWGLFSGDYNHHPEIMLPCGDQCFVCDRSHEKYILPVIFDGAQEFLKSSYFADKLPFDITNDNAEGLVDLLWDSPDGRKKVFGKKKVDKYNCAAFFFQLVATRLIIFERQNDSVTAVLARDENDALRFRSVINWEGVLFRSTAQRSTVPFRDMLPRAPKKARPCRSRSLG